MRYLHSHDIIHWDLTPESGFVDEQMEPKIGNFGLSEYNHINDGLSCQSTINSKESLVYSSPEVLQTNEYSKSSDVYSFGMIMYEIVTKNIPFQNLISLNQLITEAAINSARPEIDNNLSDAYRQLIEGCWSQNAKDRPSFDDIVNILKSDSRFITEKVEAERYFEYIKSFENSIIDFCSRQKVSETEKLIEETIVNTMTTISNNENHDNK